MKDAISKLSLQKVPLLPALLVLLLVSCGTPKPAQLAEAEKALPDQLDYNLHVKPILSDKCFACHGPDKNKREAGLRLDTPEGAFAALGKDEKRFAIVPGSLRKSEFYHRILSPDPEQVMPPKSSNLTLTPKEMAVLTKWIEDGAEYKPHWAFIKPVKPEIPAVKRTGWVRNPVDAFVLARLESERLAPSPEADKETLLRRASFDLTGLPPTLAQTDAFLKDKSPNSYEKAVDRLLASPAYGERMAAYWMDVSRFADSHGYLDDKHRPMWPWRDWVIGAFNRNLPFDQFTTWQLAGDLLPKATQEQILATGFNRNHRQNSEAGIIPEEFRVEYVADRAQAVGKAFLGLTVECARCHDHKYDPITQQEYYQLFGFFNSVVEDGETAYGGPDQTPGPSLLLSSEETDQKLAFIRARIARQEQQLQALPAAEKNRFEGWVKGVNWPREAAKSLQAKLAAWYPFDAITGEKLVDRKDPATSGTAKTPELVEGVRGKALRLNAENSVILGKGVGLFERTEPFSVSLWIKAPKVYEEAAIFYNTEHRRYGNQGYDLLLQNNRLLFRMAHTLPHNSIRVITQTAVPVNQWTQVTLTYDGSSRARGVQLYVNGQSAAVEVLHDHLYKSIVPQPNIHKVTPFLGFRLGYREIDKAFHRGEVDELQIFNERLTSLEVKQLYQSVAPAGGKAGDAVTDAEAKEYFLSRYSPAVTQQLSRLKALRDEENQLLDSIPEIMVMGDLPRPRPTYVLERGVYDAHGARVEPGTPKSVLPFPKNLPKNRLGLAKWLVSPDNPLTARVAVNRFWEMHFGKGLVSTSDDFGNQGGLPSHPELLDWLAVRFVESGWDMKALHRLIVTSATYRQSARISPEMREKDPKNVLLARGPRFRLPAEMIRDNALAAGGLLVAKVGGPSVYPYQPAGLWEALSSKSWRYNYEQSKGEGLYRRSLYTVWKRTSPPPAMLMFDAPQRSVCTVKRQTTSTPLQALVLLNDPQFIEASRGVAERMLREAGNDTRHRLTYGSRLLLGREPAPKELVVLTRLLEDEKQKFAQHPEKARAYLQTGERKPNPALNPAELAAYTVVANVLLNTDEAFTKH